MPGTGTRIDAIVVGAGPAGAATAIRLRGLGLAVALASRPRRGAVEGLSARSLELLARERLALAAASARGPFGRIGRWGDGQPVHGREWLVDRAEFDAGLLQDAAAAGVRAVPPIASIEWRGAVARLRGADGSQWRSACVVDARGRHSGRLAAQGPRLLSVAFRFAADAPAGTRLLPWADGWCWCAADGRGALIVQLVSTPARCRRAGPDALLAQAVAALPELATLLRDAQAAAAPVLCAATARAAVPVAGGKLILRVGDADVALDPLSGQGIYEALAAASGAAAAVHTLLSGGDAGAVREFLAARTLELWQRTVAAAAVHYRANAQACASAFWLDAARGYEAVSAAAAAAPPAALHAYIGMRPVLNGARIERRRVVLTPDRPRGLWQFRSVELAPLADALAAAPAATPADLATQLQRPAGDVAAAAHWLAQQALAPTTIDFRVTRENPNAANAV
jgi:2-polyprenyl-6-methoxyphenol hydroxylase-like FAD-dependent oxidoreductase